MNRILALASFALVLALALAATGCGGTPCSHACEEEIKCPGAAPRACSYECTNSQNDAAHATCLTQYQAWQGCVDAPPMTVTYCTDVPVTRCQPQHDAYAACVTAFCATHAGDPVCTPLSP